MCPEPWDGHERREAVLLADKLTPTHRTVEVPLMAVIIGFTTLALLSVGHMWAIILHSNNQHRAAAAAGEFRTQLSCFVIKISQGTPGPEILDECGFLVVRGATR